MSVTVRAKFKVVGVNLAAASRTKPGVIYDAETRGYVDADGNAVEQASETWQQPTVVLTPVYPGQDASAEDKAFWEATPNGKLEMSVTNPDAAEFFELGEAYYLTFERAEA